MVDELVNWWGVAANAAISFLVAVGVGVYIRFRVKPKYEKVFEHNRNSWIEKILSQMELFDNQYLQYVFNRFHKAGFNLKRGKEELGTSIKFVKESELESQEVTDFMEVWNQDKKLRKISEDMEPTYNRMKDLYENFFKDKVLHERYFHHDIIREMDLYFYNGLYYVEWLRKGGIHVYSCIDSRKNSAEKIIKYIEKDSTIKIKEEKLKNWIKKWKDELKRGY